MKALSIWQPWASLLAFGIKQFETRGWSTPYRGPLAICATVGKTKWQWENAEHHLVVRAMADAGMDQVPAPEAVRHGAVNVMLSAFPRGAVLAVGDLAEVTPAGIAPSDLEHMLGDWRTGRFVWRFENIRRLAQPVAITGRQKLFNVEPAVAAAVMDQLRE